MKLVKEHINEIFKKDSDPIKDMGIGEGKWIVVFYDYADDEVIFYKKFYTKKEAQDYVDSCEHQFQDEAYDENGNEIWKTFTRWYSSENKETYFGYDIREI